MPTQQTSSGNGTSTAHDLFALTDEQILQIEPDAQGIEVIAGERSDTMDPLREDLALLASGGAAGAVQNSAISSALDTPDANVAPDRNTASAAAQPSGTAGNANTAATAEPPTWLLERMNDPANGADARALWESVQAARQEASAFREVFAKPSDARAVAERARVLDDFDHAYFGAVGAVPEQLSAARAELAGKMLREDPAAFREMVFAGLRALESAAQQGSAANASGETSRTSVAPPFRAASSEAPAARIEAPKTQPPAPQSSFAAQQNVALQQPATPDQHNTQRHDAHVAAYAAFERATNAELERSVGGAIDRSLQAALPNATRSENGSALKERLGAAIRQDVEKALQGDRALGEQVARVLSGQRLDDATRAQVVRLIGDRAQQLVPGSARKVLADWTETTLASHGSRGRPSAGSESAGSASSSVITASTTTSTAASTKTPSSSGQGSPPHRTNRKIDYRRVSDSDILDF